ncbi:MAG: pseudouridine synthase [Cyanobacteria bacterium P01_E01_bin.35]
MAERVQKVLSQWGIASRRKAEQMIIDGRVQINGQTAILGDKVDLTVDRLQVDGTTVKNVHRPTLVYLLLNKPEGVVSTCDDPQNRTTVLDLLAADLRQGKGIHPVGRLDFASSGALILTNDGQLTLGLTHPRYHLPKTYLVKLDRSPTKRDLTCWRQGIMLDGKKTRAAKINFARADRARTTLEIVLTEGRNRQIRRVAQKLGYQVNQLHRKAIGSITLDLGDGSKVEPGKYRHLRQSEINFLKNLFQAKYSSQVTSSGSAVYEQ